MARLATALSKKAKKAMEVSDLPKFYFDLKKYYKALEGRQSPWTPPIGLIMAADYSCKKILTRGLENIQAGLDLNAKPSLVFEDIEEGEV